MTYNQLTIAQFIQCVKIWRSELEETDKIIAIAAFLANKSTEEIESMPFDEAEKHISKVKSLLLTKPTERVRRTVWIGGRPYKALTDIGTFSTSRLLSLEHYNATDKVNNLHKALALLYAPYFDKLDKNENYPDYPMHVNDKLAEKILSKKVGEVYGAAFFFGRRFSALSWAIQAYLKLKENQAIAERVITKDHSSESSSATMAGTIH